MTDVLGPADAGAVNTLTTTTDVSNPTAGDTWFQDCVANNPATGTNLPSRFMNRLLQQVRRIIRLTGVPESNTDDDMLGQAIQSGALNWAGTFGGAADALTATLAPAPVSLTAGMRVAGLISTVSATTTPTLNVNGLGAQTILQPSGAALAVGAVAVYGEFIWNGSNWEMTIAPAQVARGGVLNTQIFSTAGTFTYTPTVGTTKINVTVVGGGAAGGGSQAMGSTDFQSAGAGGAGGVAISNISSGFSGVTITVGAGGVGAVSAGSGTSGASGGSSSFGSLLSATGGAGGGAANNVSVSGALQAGGAGGSGTGGNLFNGVGGYGGYGSANQSTNQVGGLGGASYFGQGGGSVFSATLAGLPGITKGSGGGGAVGANSGAAVKGGNGASGQVIVVEYA